MLIFSHPSWPPPRPFRCAGQKDESDRRCQFFHCSSSPLPIRCKKLKESLMKNRLVFSLIGAVLIVLPTLSQADESPFSFLRVYKLADGRRISISVPGEWRELSKTRVLKSGAPARFLDESGRKIEIAAVDLERASKARTVFWPEEYQH